MSGVLLNVEIAKRNTDSLKKCVFMHKEVDSQPRKKPKKNCGNGSVALLKNSKLLGCVFQDVEPPQSKSILRKDTQLLRPKRSVQFPKGTLRNVKIGKERVHRFVVFHKNTHPSHAQCTWLDRIPLPRPHLLQSATERSVLAVLPKAPLQVISSRFAVRMLRPSSIGSTFNSEDIATTPASSEVDKRPNLGMASPLFTEKREASAAPARI